MVSWLVSRFVLLFAPDTFHCHRHWLRKVKIADDIFSRIIRSLSLLSDIIAAILASITPAMSIVLFTAVLYLIGRKDPAFPFRYTEPLLLGHPNDDRLRSSRSNTVTNQPATTNQREVIRPAGQKAILPVSNSDKIERATSPVDARILEEFYTDRPREMHSYQLNGRRYVVFEGRTLSEQDSLRRGKS